jgi:hypothetical protein
VIRRSLVTECGGNAADNDVNSWSPTDAHREVYSAAIKVQHALVRCMLEYVAAKHDDGHAQSSKQLDSPSNQTPVLPILNNSVLFRLPSDVDDAQYLSRHT